MPTRPKVLLVTNNLPPVRGGSAIVYHNLAHHADGAIMVIAPKVNYQDGLALIGWREHDRLAPFRVIRLNLLRTVMNDTVPSRQRISFRIQDMVIRARLLATVLRCALFQRINAVCIGELVASAWLLSVLRLVPWVTRVVYVHGEEITTRDDYDIRQQRRRRALLAAHHVVVVSRFTASEVSALLGAAAGTRIRLIENGVDILRFRPLPRRHDLNALYGLEGCFVFISVCRLLEKKGVDQAIRAFAQVVKCNPDARYLVVGEGPYRQALETIAALCDVADKVVFAGSVADDDLTEHYALGDVFVMPNRRLANGDTEGFGLVFLEANACGLPVIAGSDGGSVDAVQHGVNGLLVDGNSVPAITAAMLELQRDANLRARLRANGFAAAEKAGWTNRTRAFLEMLEPTMPAGATKSTLHPPTIASLPERPMPPASATKPGDDARSD